MLYYLWDLDDACDEVADIIYCYGRISAGEVEDIACYYDVSVSDILDEFGWLD